MNEITFWALHALMALGFFALMWYGSIATHSLMLHRLTTHRQFILSKTMRLILHLLYWIFNGSCYLSPIGYAILHTLHHRFTDTKDDPHPPMSFKNWCLYMWHTWKMYDAANKGELNDTLLMYTGKKPSDFPQWDMLDWIAQMRLVRIIWILLYVKIYYLILPDMTAMLWASPFIFITCFMGPFHGFIVNWFGHKIGYRTFSTDDESRNVLRKDWLLLGELLHHNHHKEKESYTFALLPGEVDPLGNLLQFLERKGIVRLPKKMAVV